MMQIESDLHIEFNVRVRPSTFLAPRARYLLLAGDICPLPTHRKEYEQIITYCASQYEKVFVVAGNHEYYNARARAGAPKRSPVWTMSRCNDEIVQICSQFPNVHFLQRSVCYIEEFNLSVTGTTLWSDTPDPVPMNDYTCIYKDDGTLLTHHDTRAMFLCESAWLRQAVEEERAKGRRVLALTHHLPSFQLIAPKYKNSGINSGFASNLDDLVGLVNYWVCGHTHTRMETSIGECTICINPRGYPGESQYVPMILDITPP